MNAQPRHQNDRVASQPTFTARQKENHVPSRTQSRAIPRPSRGCGMGPPRRQGSVLAKGARGAETDLLLRSGRGAQRAIYFCETGAGRSEGSAFAKRPKNHRMNGSVTTPVFKMPALGKGGASAPPLSPSGHRALAPEAAPLDPSRIIITDFHFKLFETPPLRSLALPPAFARMSPAPASPDGRVAQLGERLVRNEEVRGSSPLTSTKFP